MCRKEAREFEMKLEYGVKSSYFWVKVGGGRFICKYSYKYEHGRVSHNKNCAVGRARPVRTEAFIFMYYSLILAM